MTLPDDLAAWRKMFLAGTGLSPAELEADPDLVDDAAAADEAGDPAARTAKRIPARYARALVTEPGILSWLEIVLQQAISDRRGVAAVTTGPSLLLLGATGTGKTWQSYGTVRGLSALGLHGRWELVAAPDLYARMRPRHGVDSEDEFRRFADARPLIVDDLGAGKGSEWTEEVNYRLVNHRYEHDLPTIFTSNIGARDLADALGERVASRLTEMTERISLKGTDRRYAGSTA